MCDMYGHGYWTGEKALYDYLQWNSHREIRGVQWELREAWVGRCLSVSVAPVDATPYGIDPINGKVLVQGNTGHEQDALSSSDRTIIAATWDNTICSREKLCEWIEAHFGKRDDKEDWSIRGPQLIAPGGRGPLRLSTTYIATTAGNSNLAYWAEGAQRPYAQSASKLIDLFRKHPNQWWAGDKPRIRHEHSKVILEEAGLN